MQMRTFKQKPETGMRASKRAKKRSELLIDAEYESRPRLG